MRFSGSREGEKCGGRVLGLRIPPWTYRMTTETTIIARVRTRFRRAIVRFYSAYLHRVWGMDIGEGCIISLKATLDYTNPAGIHIGRYTGVAFGAVILAHDFNRNRHVDTWIGERCQIGARSIIYPGVRIGDGCVIAAGAVVMNNIPAGCIAAGNPARVVERNINPGKYGIRVDVIPADKVDPLIVTTNG